jgi:hypothetical protein
LRQPTGAYGLSQASPDSVMTVQRAKRHGGECTFSLVRHGTIETQVFIA